MNKYIPNPFRAGETHWEGRQEEQHLRQLTVWEKDLKYLPLEGQSGINQTKPKAGSVLDSSPSAWGLQQEKTPPWVKFIEEKRLRH